MSLFEPGAGEVEKIILHRLPLPPTSNHQYTLVRRGNKTFHVPSKELKIFKEEMEVYPLMYSSICRDAISKAQSWVKDQYPLSLKCIFYFRKDRLFTKDNRIKKLDVSNRLKASHDELSKLLGIDDSLFFKIYAEKTISRDSSEMFSAEIKPILEKRTNKLC